MWTVQSHKASVDTEGTWKRNHFTLEPSTLCCFSTSNCLTIESEFSVLPLLSPAATVDSCVRVLCQRGRAKVTVVTVILPAAYFCDAPHPLPNTPKATTSRVKKWMNYTHKKMSSFSNGLFRGDSTFRAWHHQPRCKENKWASVAFSANPAGNLRAKSAFFKDWDMNGEIQSQLGCLLGGRTHQRSHFAARPRQTPAPGSLWLSQVQCFRFSRLSEQIMSLCFACITQCHLVTLKRGLFGGSVALLSQEWVVNCQGAARVSLCFALFFLLRRKETQ